MKIILKRKLDKLSLTSLLWCDFRKLWVQSLFFCLLYSRLALFLRPEMLTCLAFTSFFILATFRFHLLSAKSWWCVGIVVLGTGTNILSFTQHAQRNERFYTIHSYYNTPTSIRKTRAGTAAVSLNPRMCRCKAPTSPLNADRCR